MTIITNLLPVASARDYAWLKDAVAGWMHRPDLAAMIPDFVMLAEKRINAELDARLQSGEAVLDTVAGDALLMLPDDFIGVFALTDPDAGALEYMTPSALADAYAGAPFGTPRCYTVQGRSIKLGPAPDGARQLTLSYRAGVPALADAGSNWMLDQHPDIYLAATMCEACTYTVNPNLPMWDAKYSAAMNALNRQDWNRTGTLAIRPDARTA